MKKLGCVGGGDVDSVLLVDPGFAAFSGCRYDGVPG